MKRNRKEEIIRLAFEKAKRNSISEAKSALAKLIAEEISENHAQIASKTIERAFDKYILGDGSKGEPNPETIELLCKYSGYENYGDFIGSKPQPTTSGTKVDAIGKNRVALMWSVGVVLLGMLSVWGIKSWIGDQNSTQSCMVWRQTKYEKVKCNQVIGLNVEPLDEVKLNTFKKIEVTMATEFFDEETERPLIWYHKNKSGEIEYYSAPGLHPVNGKTLDEITPYIIQKYVPVHVYRPSSFAE